MCLICIILSLYRKGVAHICACGLICSISEWHNFLLSGAGAFCWLDQGYHRWAPPVGFGRILLPFFCLICPLCIHCSMHVWGRCLCINLQLYMTIKQLPASSIKGAPHQKDITPFMRSITRSSVTRNFIIVVRHIPIHTSSNEFNPDKDTSFYDLVFHPSHYSLYLA